MARFLSGLVMTVLAVATVTAEMPKPAVIVDTFEVKIEPDNPYFKDWETTVHPGGEILSVKMPVLQDLPENTMMSIKVQLSGQVVLDSVSTVCDTLDDESFGKNIVEYAEPKGQFPEKCPFVKGETFEIVKYEIPQEKLPQNTQEGPFHAEVKIYTDSEDNPEVLLVADGEVVHK